MALGPAHTNAFSFENAYNSTRLDLPSALIRWAFSLKTHRFENACETKRIKTKTHTYHISVGGRKRIEWKWRPKISQARVLVACAKSSTYVTTSNSIPFYGQSRYHENGSVDANRSTRFQWQQKRFSADRAAINKAGTGTYSFRKMSRDARKLAWTILSDNLFQFCNVNDSHEYNIFRISIRTHWAPYSKQLKM